LEYAIAIIDTFYLERDFISWGAGFRSPLYAEQLFIQSSSYSTRRGFW